jgi:hypothetical protein
LEALDDLAAASHRERLLSSSALDARAARSAVSEDIVQDIIGGEEVQWPPASTTATDAAVTAADAAAAASAGTLSRSAAAFAATAGAVLPLFSSSVSELARQAKKADFRRWTASGVLRLSAVDVTAATDEFGSSGTSDWDWAAMWNNELTTTSTITSSRDSTFDSSAGTAAAAASAGVNGAGNSMRSFSCMFTPATTATASATATAAGGVNGSVNGSVNGGLGEHVRRELAAADVDAALAQLQPDEEEELFDADADTGNREVYTVLYLYIHVVSNTNNCKHSVSVHVIGGLQRCICTVACAGAFKVSSACAMHYSVSVQSCTSTSQPRCSRQSASS